MHKAVAGLLALVSMLAMSSAVAKENPGWVAIEAEGIGETQDAAVQMALQEAVTEAVGALVTAKTLIENGQIVQDSIISHSGGFVESYVIDEGPIGAEGGLVRVRITARVGKTRLVSTLQEIKVELNEFAGQDVAGQAFSIDLNRKTGREVWGEIIDQFFVTEKMYIPSVIGYQLINTEGPVAKVAFRIGIEANRTYYFDECLPALMTVAEQTCIKRIEKTFEVKLKERAFAGVVEGGSGEPDVAEVIEYKDIAKQMGDIDKKISKKAAAGQKIYSLFFLTAIDGNKGRFIGFTFEPELYSYIATKMCRVGYRAKVKDESYYGGYAAIPYEEPVLSLRGYDSENNEVVLRRCAFMSFLGPASFVERGGDQWVGQKRYDYPDRFAKDHMLAISPMISTQYGGYQRHGILMDRLEFGAVLLFETSELSQVDNVAIALNEAGRSLSDEGLGLIILDADDPWVGRYREQRLIRNEIFFRERHGDVPDDDEGLNRYLKNTAKEDRKLFVESTEWPNRLWVRIFDGQSATIGGGLVSIPPGFYLSPRGLEQ